MSLIYLKKIDGVVSDLSPIIRNNAVYHRYSLEKPQI